MILVAFYDIYTLFFRKILIPLSFKYYATLHVSSSVFLIISTLFVCVVCLFW